MSAPASRAGHGAGTPTLRVLSLGAGVQSTALLILAARGDLEPLDAAVFADTGWEPDRVYAHLDRIEAEVARPAGIPILRVRNGHIREDALDPAHRFASMPLYVRNADGQEGLARRQCTNEYKLKPLRWAVKALLGAPPGPDGRPGRVPAGRWAEQWIGISADESHRALDSKSTAYMPARWPLLERGLSRADCAAINAAAGFPDTPKSACIGCPYHRNAQWRQMRDEHPDEWADAVAFDAAIRHGSARATALGQPLRGQMYLHRSLLPLDQAPIDRITRTEWRTRQTDLLAELSAATVAGQLDDDEPVYGCGPHACRLPADPDDPDEDTDTGPGTEAA
ncbi:MAG TPA: hypothetical protein VI248_05150 [Kineosporiaceae bacterium]